MESTDRKLIERGIKHMKKTASQRYSEKNRAQGKCPCCPQLRAEKVIFQAGAEVEPLTLEALLVSHEEVSLKSRFQAR